jgi:DNA-binding MarR family transcriptional regulator
LPSEGKGQRFESPRARAHTLALTPAGAALIPMLASPADENDAEFFADLTVEERATLDRVLKGIVARHGLKAIPIT